MATWELRLKSAAGATVAIFDRWLEFTCTRTVNAPATYALHLDGADSRVALFALDGQLEAWRSDAANGIAWYKELEAFHVNRKRWHDAGGASHFLSSGKGYQDLLERTIVYATSGSAESAKSDKAETVIKAYIDEQAGPGAGARARSGLAIQADGATGNTISLQRSYRNLLAVCQDIAAVGGGDFDVIGTGAAAFEFRWYLGQRGTDRTATVVFALERGNMAEPVLEEKRAQVINAALVGGQGEGASRDLDWREDAVSIALSTWNRRERFVDAREVPQGDATALENKGDAVLAESAATESLSFRVLQTPGCLYGRDYFLGDLVTARYADTSFAKKVQSVEMTVNPNGETIDVHLIDP